MQAHAATRPPIPAPATATTIHAAFPNAPPHASALQNTGLLHVKVKTRPFPASIQQPGWSFAGRDYAEHGFVNPAVYHGSNRAVSDGTVTSRSIADLCLLPPRNADITCVWKKPLPWSKAVTMPRCCRRDSQPYRRLCWPFSSAERHLLMVDTVYQPARHFLRWPAQGTGCRDHLLRSTCRTRIAHTDAAQYAGLSTARAQVPRPWKCRTSPPSRKRHIVPARS